MDNLTHSLAGALSVELCAGLLPERWRPTRRPALFVTAVLANNVPDLDFAYAFVTEGKLGYLLHHRGHTHTLLGAIALWGLLAGLGLAWSRRWRDEFAGRDRAWLVGLALFGGLLHVAMDFGNSYGVHPFWPWDASWYYGDTIFIIEPWLWVIFGLTLFASSKPRLARAFAILPVGLALAFVWALPVPWPAAVALTAGVSSFVLLRRRLERSRHALCVLFVGALYTIAVVTRVLVGSVVEREVASEPSLRVLDLVRSPMPATPWCWDVIQVAIDGSQEAPEYVVRYGRVGLIPSLGGPRNCPESREGFTAEVVPRHVDRGRVSWDFEYRRSLADLASAARDCHFQALLRFARVPYYEPASQRAGDLRYDRSEEDEFADVRLQGGQPCPKWVPPWDPPRADLLRITSDTR